MSKSCSTGRILTVYAAGPKLYRTVLVEGGADAALDEVRQVFGVEAAGGVDLLYSNPYEGLLYDVESGTYIGESVVGDVRAHHLAYRAADVDWQLWIRADGTPLPLKYVITSKWMTGAPQFSVEVRDWTTDAKVSDEEFTFTAPDGARAIEGSDIDALGLLLKE